MDDSDLRIFAAQLRQGMPTLDLHKYRPAEALDALEFFLFRLVEQNETEARVIYGIGTGAMREQVIHYLQTHKLIDKIVEEAGSAIVLLKDY